jgi:hypothetical protein
MSEILEQEKPSDKRPVFLTVMGIISLVYMGWSILSSIFSLFRGPMSEDQMEQYKVEITKSINQTKGVDGMELFEEMMRSTMNMVESMNANHYMNLLSSILILVVGVVGVIFMLRRRKLGFHLYIMYSFLTSIQIYLFVAPSTLSNAIVIVSLLFSGIFVLLYGLNLKWMK